MKIEFKINAMNLISFLTLMTLFFWLFPFPKSHIWSDVCGFVGVVFLIFACFVVVSRKPLVRKGAPSAEEPDTKKDNPPHEK